MLSARTRFKRLILCCVGIVMLTILIVCLYFHHRANVYAKTKPYVIALQVMAERDAEVSVFYDYGYGFHAGHQRKLKLNASSLALPVEFSVSAWKPIKALRFNGFEQSGAILNSIVIRKADKQYSIEYNNDENIQPQEAFVIDDVDRRLRRLEGAQ